MAARQRLPSSSGSHAPEDYPDSLQVPAYWETKWVIDGRRMDWRLQSPSPEDV